jgi:hypothetical protein
MARDRHLGASADDRSDKKCQHRNHEDDDADPEQESNNLDEHPRMTNTTNAIATTPIAASTTTATLML